MKRDTTDNARPKLWQRLLWFAGIWLGSVVVLALVAFAIRVVLKG
jgi:hypothetical protein